MNRSDSSFAIVGKGRPMPRVLVSLPMLGQVASLNAATAGAIALFDLLRRQLDSQTGLKSSGAVDVTGET